MLYILAIIVFVVLSSALVRGFILSQRIMDSLDKPKKKRIQNVTFTRLESIRQLTEEEDILLQPYLDNKDLITCPYQWESSLISSDVTTIKGYIKREHANNAKIKDAFYYKMDDISLFFPYSMDHHIAGFDGLVRKNTHTNIEPINTAEVVFTKSYAIVVKINNYDLLQAGLNLSCRKENQIKEYWQTGKLKPIPLSRAESANETFTQLITEESEKVPTFEILNKREKNQFETAIEDRSNSGKLMIGLFVFGVMGLLALEHFQSLVLVAFSIICFILSMIASYIKREIPSEYVNHIKAQIRDNCPVNHQLSIESNFNVFYPEHWKMFLPNNSDVFIDMQAELETAQLLSYGDYLSISEEVKNYGAPKFIYHNVLLAITGLILAVLMFFLTNAGEKLDFTYQILNDLITIRNIDDKNSINKSSIKPQTDYNAIFSGNSSNLKKADIVKIVNYHNEKNSKLLVTTQTIYNFDKNQLFSFSSPILINNCVFLLVILISLINSILIIWKKGSNHLRLEKIISNYKDKFIQDTN